MILQQGIDLALRRILQPNVEKQIMGITEPQQLAERETPIPAPVATADTTAVATTEALPSGRILPITIPEKYLPQKREIAAEIPIETPQEEITMTQVQSVIPPQGMTLSVEDDNGNPLDIVVNQDLSVWYQETKVGNLNKQTGLFEPSIPEEQIEEVIKPEWYEKPKVWAEEAEERVGEVVSRIPGLPKALQWMQPGFEWIHENLEKPWAAIVTAPWSTKLPYEVGEDWLEHEKREYESWEAPIYAKGAAEFSMPLWWLPWIGWAGKGARALGIANKLSKAGKLLPKTGKILYPSFETWQSHITDNFMRKLAYWGEHKPIINSLIKAVGGPAAFIKRNPQTLADKARNMAVYRATMLDMGQQLIDVKIPKLYTYLGRKTERDLLQLTEKKIGKETHYTMGVVTTNAEKQGFKVGNKVSFEFDDVITHPELYEWTSKEAKAYMDYAHELGEFFTKMATDNGIKLPRSWRFKDPEFQYLPRIVEAVEKGKGLEVLKGTPDPFKDLIYETALEGVQNGVKYGGSVINRVNLFGHAVTRRIAKDKFTKAVEALSVRGKGGLELLETYNPKLAENLAYHSNKINVLKKTVSALKGAEPLKGGYRPIHGAILNSISADFPQLANRIATELSINPNKVADWITKMGKASGIPLKDSKPIVEALKALPQKASLDDALEIVTRFSRSEERGIKLMEKIYQKEAQAQLKYYSETVSKLTNDVTNMLKQERNVIKPFTKEATLLKKQLQQPVKGWFESTFRIETGLQGKIYPAEVVETIEPMLLDRGNQWLKQTAAISGTSRILTATLDLSAPMIQGLLVFGSNPIAWVKAVAKMLRITSNPRYLWKELASREASRLDRVLHGGSTSMIDYFEAMPILRKGAGKIKAGRLVSETYGRAEAAFLGFGEIARDELWKTGRLGIMKKGLDAARQEEQLTELARALDRMTGVMSTKALGMGLTQSQFESSWIFFAPRYTRAGLSFAGDMLRGGFVGAKARTAMAGFLLGGLTMYNGTCVALGQQPNFDPLSGKFMTIKVGDRYVGIRGFWVTGMRFLADVAATAVEEPERLSPLFLSRVDQPFYKYMYARTAPLTGMTVGLAIEHKNYFGEPFESPADYAAFMADKVIPIAMQQLMPWEQKPWLTSKIEPRVIVPEIAGMTTFAKSTWEARDDAREKLALNIYNISWKQLTRAQQRNLELNYPILTQWDDEIKKRQISGGRPLDILFNRWQDETENSKENRDMRIWLVAQRAIQLGDMKQFRESVNDIESDYGAELDLIQRNKEYIPVFEELAKPTKAEEISEMQALDVAYDVYAGIRYSKGETQFGKMMNEFGEPEWENIDKFRQWFSQTYGAEALKYAEEDRPLAGRNLPQLYTQLRRDRKLLKVYWEGDVDFQKRAGVLDDIELQKAMQVFRQEYRKANPQIDALLNLWGYVTTVKTKEAKQLLIQMANKLGIPTENLPALVKKIGVTKTQARWVNVPKGWEQYLK